MLCSHGFRQTVDGLLDGMGKTNKWQDSKTKHVIICCYGDTVMFNACRWQKVNIYYLLTAMLSIVTSILSQPHLILLPCSSPFNDINQLGVQRIKKLTVRIVPRIRVTDRIIFRISQKKIDKTNKHVFICQLRVTSVW